jgi:hypothetical protein
MQRAGTVGQITVCALNSGPLKKLKNDREILEAFPGQDFMPFPSLDEPPDKNFPDLYREVLSGMKPRQVVVVAVPDQLHYSFVLNALNNHQHVLCVKPLVLEYAHVREIEKEARSRGLFVGVEYHKRFDRRSLLARKQYVSGQLGEFTMGEARLIEPRHYRSSNFQNWFTPENTDPFVYVGCHYVDLVHFITGLRPVQVSVSGIRGRFPNGNGGFMWANGRVTYENGALLSVINGLGYPDGGAGSNDQGLIMFFEGEEKTGMLKHNDQFRGVTHSYLAEGERKGSLFHYINPDFIQLVPWEGVGYRPVGYGYDSVSAMVKTVRLIEEKTGTFSENEARLRRLDLIEEISRKGIIATPSSSFVDVLVSEAARVSIRNEAARVDIVYGEKPHVELRD